MKYLLASAMLLAFTANAQVYKCENNGQTTFSQVPCGDDAEAVKVNVSGQSSAIASTGDVEQACLEHLRLTNNWKDPDSLKVEGSYKSWDSDKSGARHILNISINAKNSYGAYGGSETYQCFLNHGGDKLSTVQRYIR